MHMCTQINILQKYHTVIVLKLCSLQLLFHIAILNSREVQYNYYQHGME